jgi:hypothetical protein
MGTPAAMDVCATFCAANGFRYMGMQWTSECFCDNEYGSFGSAPLSECDIDGDGTMDCGTMPINRDDFVNVTTPCGLRNAVYELGGDSPIALGCYNDGGGSPKGLTLGGDTYYDNNGGLGWSRGPGLAEYADDDTNTRTDDFGLHFDGKGDYAMIDGIDSGYASDGTFAISMWATRPSCRLSGRPEIIFSHLAQPGNWSASGVIIMYLCEKNDWGAHSTVQRSGNGDILRISMTDSDGARARFDVAMSDAASGGYVDESWVHMMLAVDRVGGRGSSAKMIRFYLDGRRVQPWHIGYPAYIPQAMEGDSVRLNQTGLAQADAEKNCATTCGRSYGYFGLSGSGSCSCSETVDGNSPADYAPTAPAAMCDPDLDEVPDCGVGGDWSSCRGAVAVYEKTPSGSFIGYVGCYWNNGTWGPNYQDPAVNAAYSDDRRTRLDSVNIGDFNMDQSYNVGRNDTADYYIPVAMNSATQSFYASGGRYCDDDDDDCWNGGFWEVWSADADGAPIEVIAGGMMDADADGAPDGVVDSPDEYFSFTTTAAAGVVHIHVGSRDPGIKWSLSDAGGVAEAYGPAETPIYLGGHAPFGDSGSTDGNFVGNIVDVAIFDRPPQEDEVNCMFRKQSSNIGSCRAPDGMWRTTLWEPFTDGDNLAEGLRLSGDATIDPNGAGLDLTGNDVARQMGGGTYYWMDGLGRAGTLNDQLLTQELCLSTCQTDGYTYAGLQWGQECFCDNGYGTLGLSDPVEARDAGCYSRGRQSAERDARDLVCNAATDADGCTAVDEEMYCRWSEAREANDGCDEPCLGDTTQPCGGGFRNAVYDVATSEYKGCYMDKAASSARVSLPEDYAQDATFTISFWFTKGYCGATNVTSRYEPIYYEGGEWCNKTAHPDANCPTARIGVVLACGINTTAGDNTMTVHTFMVDDAGQSVSFDVPLNDARSGGSMTDTWIHFALSVGGDTVTPYIDGRPERRVAYSDWHNNAQNLAWRNTTGMSEREMRGSRDGKIQLAQPLSGFNFTAVPLTLGFSHGHSGSHYYNGFVAGLGVYGREISGAEASCLYKYGETHLGIPSL